MTVLHSMLKCHAYNSGIQRSLCNAIKHDHEYSRLRMPHIEALIKTQRIMCMKKYLDSYNSTWKMFLDSYLADFGGSFLIRCNYDVRFLPKTLPEFYKECLSEWADY